MRIYIDPTKLKLCTVPYNLQYDDNELNMNDKDASYHLHDTKYRANQYPVFEITGRGPHDKGISAGWLLD